MHTTFPLWIVVIPACTEPVVKLNVIEEVTVVDLELCMTKTRELVALEVIVLVTVVTAVVDSREAENT